MKKKYVYIIIFLIVASCAAFGRIAGNDFISFDDGLYITENRYIQSGFNAESIKWAFISFFASNWHPLTWFSHMIDWQFFGANASGHHLVSLLFHVGTAIFLFLFLYKTTINFWPAAFAAAFFVLHPLRVESVAWAAERKDVLSMFFCTASLYAYAIYAESAKLSKYILCLILFTLGLMSKPMIVTLPFIMMLLDYWPLKRLQAMSPSKENELKIAGILVLEKIPFIILSIAVSALAFWAQIKGGAVVNVKIIPFAERFSNAIVSYISYLEKTFWPVNLTVFYPFEFSLPLWNVLISGIILISMTIVVLYNITRLPFLFTGWFIYLGALVPVIGLVQVGEQSMADRYTYLPSIGIVIMLAWGISDLINNQQKGGKFFFTAAIIVLAALAILTYNQCGYWKNSIILYNHTLRVTKNNYKIHHNMGASFFQEGKINEAEYHFDKATKINPNYLSYNSIGEIHARAGKYQQAFDDFNKAISLNPRDPDGYYNRGLTYDVMGQFQQALADFNKAISLNGNHVNAYNSRGIVYAKLGQHQEAIEDFTKTISIKTDYVHAYANRAIAYFSQGKNEGGCSDAAKACRMGNCNTLQDAEAKGLCR